MPEVTRAEWKGSDQGLLFRFEVLGAFVFSKMYLGIHMFGKACYRVYYTKRIETLCRKEDAMVDNCTADTTTTRLQLQVESSCKICATTKLEG